MPSVEHEAPIELLRSCPSLIIRLLRECAGVDVPDRVEAFVVDSNLSEVVPAGRRADLVITLRRPKSDETLMGLIVEVQRSVDEEKRYAWPRYCAALHERIRAPVCLAVITDNERTDAWAEKPIHTLQLGSTFQPIVLGPSRIPRIASEQEASAAPELAVLSALAHNKSDGGLAVVLAALLAVESSLGSFGELYFSLIYAVLDKEQRARLEATMDDRHEMFETDYTRRFFARLRASARAYGLAEGRAAGKAEAVLAFLVARQLSVSDEQRQMIEGCTDLERLDQMIRRAATATNTAELFEAE